MTRTNRVAAVVAVTVLIAAAALVWLLFGGERIGPSPGIGPMVPSTSENVRLLGGRADLVVEMLVPARGLAGRPIPDALVVAAALEADALPLATFDREQCRYGVETKAP